MKVKMLLGGEGFEKGEIVEAKRFKDLADEEMKRETRHPEMWDGDEIFAKRHSRTDDMDCLYLYDEECEIIEE